MERIWDHTVDRWIAISLIVFLIAAVFLNIMAHFYQRQVSILNEGVLIFDWLSTIV